MHAIEKFLRKCLPEQRVGPMYVIDQLCRMSRDKYQQKDPFGPRFALKMATDVLPLLAEVEGDDQSSVKRVLRDWKSLEFFGPEVMGGLGTFTFDDGATFDLPASGAGESRARREKDGRHHRSSHHPPSSSSVDIGRTSAQGDTASSSRVGAGANLPAVPGEQVSDLMSLLEMAVGGGNGGATGPAQNLDASAARAQWQALPWQEQEEVQKKLQEQQRQQMEEMAKSMSGVLQQYQIGPSQPGKAITGQAPPTVPEASAPPPPASKKVYPCNRIRDTGTCHYGSACLFAHSEEERKAALRGEVMAPGGAQSSRAGTNPLYKTKLCVTVTLGGSQTCMYGDRCSFAHSEAELRVPPGKEHVDTAAPMVRCRDGQASLRCLAPPLALFDVGARPPHPSLLPAFALPPLPLRLRHVVWRHS